MADYSTRYGQALGNAAQGAAYGTSIAPGIGTIIGGGLGLISGLFSKSDEEIMQERYQEYLKQLEEQNRLLEQQRQNALIQAAQTMGRYTSGLQERFGSDAARRAAALGRMNSTATIANPIIGKIADAGSSHLADLNFNINNAYDARKQRLSDYQIQGAGDFQSRPIQPTVGDYFSQLAPLAAMTYKGFQGTKSLTPDQITVPQVSPSSPMNFNDLPLEGTMGQYGQPNWNENDYGKVQNTNPMWNTNLSFYNTYRNPSPIVWRN